jgi:ABC-type transport system involved in cytochrome bd biosynthesis fused ATPase/permease subunit
VQTVESRQFQLNLGHALPASVVRRWAFKRLAASSELPVVDRLLARVDNFDSLYLTLYWPTLVLLGTAQWFVLGIIVDRFFSMRKHC